ncbi:hypothetical protein AtubIFM56815_007627 [Aspergillus tubingensis]|uniref:Uncharacterized protein n=1 Tax=Aspergillus tubingensis TaxID=5068 RepID=A0A9W6AN10_ASPTU|nr:hypothetical protein AtubIFM56815_007627 [Aspergillus tubingensis]
MQKKRKAQAPQHLKRQPKKPCRQQNSAVPDPVNIDQENNQWPKKLFNSVLRYVLISPPESSEPTEEYEDENKEEGEKSNENRIGAYVGDKFRVLP